MILGHGCCVVRDCVFSMDELSYGLVYWECRCLCICLRMRLEGQLVCVGSGAMQLVVPYFGGMHA
jgi:hypothetical protein